MGEKRNHFKLKKKNMEIHQEQGRLMLNHEKTRLTRKLMTLKKDMAHLEQKISSERLKILHLYADLGRIKLKTAFLERQVAQKTAWLVRQRQKLKRQRQRNHSMIVNRKELQYRASKLKQVSAEIHAW